LKIEDRGGAGLIADRPHGQFGNPFEFFELILVVILPAKWEDATMAQRKIF
jgi:hypothetical protein